MMTRSMIFGSFRRYADRHAAHQPARASAQIVLMPTVTRFLAAYPGVNVEIVTNNALMDMVSEGFDAGVRFGEVIARDMTAMPLGLGPAIRLCGSARLLPTLSQAEQARGIEGIPCIRFRFESGRYYGWESERDGVEFAVEVDGQLTLGEQDLAIQAALDGTGSPSPSKHRSSS